MTDQNQTPVYIVPDDEFGLMRNDLSVDFADMGKGGTDIAAGLAAAIAAYPMPAQPEFMVIPDNSGTMRPAWIASAELQLRAMGDIHGVPPTIISAGQMGVGKSWHLGIRTNDEPPESHTYSRKRKKSKMRKNRK